MVAVRHRSGGRWFVQRQGGTLDVPQSSPCIDCRSVRDRSRGWPRSGRDQADQAQGHSRHRVALALVEATWDGTACLLARPLAASHRAPAAVERDRGTPGKGALVQAEGPYAGTYEVRVRSVLARAKLGGVASVRATPLMETIVESKGSSKRANGQKEKEPPARTAAGWRYLLRRADGIRPKRGHERSAALAHSTQGELRGAQGGDTVLFQGGAVLR